MDWQLIAVMLAVGAAGCYLVWNSWQSWRASKSGCGGTCGCAGARDQGARSPQSTALIPTDQLITRLRQANRK